MTPELSPVLIGTTMDVETRAVLVRLVEVADCDEPEPDPGPAVTGTTREELALGVMLAEIPIEEPDVIGAV